MADMTLDENAKLRRANADIIEALTQALEYFEDRSDTVDGSHGRPEPNKEMYLAQLCRDALGKIT